MVFIGGAARSGTTMLAQQVAKLLGVRFTPEAYFLLEILLAHEWRSSVESKALRFRLQTWGMAPEGISELATTSRSAKDFLAKVFIDSNWQAPAVVEGIRSTSLWIEHTPRNAQYFDVLLRAFPDAIGINLVRDGRAVFASTKKVDFGPRAAHTAAWWWQASVLSGLQAQVLFPERVISLTYEDVVADWEATATRLANFLQSRGFNCPGSQGTRAQIEPVRLPSFTREHHRLVGEQADRTRIDSWRTTLTEREIRSFEATAGLALVSLGYELVHPRGLLSTRRRIVDGLAGAAREAVSDPLRRLSRFARPGLATSIRR